WSPSDWPRPAHSLTLPLEQKPEHKPVRDEEQRYHDSRDEVGGPQLTRCGPDTLIERVEQIGTTPKVEHPDQDDSQPALQRRQREQGQDRGNQITVCRRVCESGRQVRRDNAGHQECQADESEAVQEEERPQGAVPRLAAQCWPEVSRRDDPPGNEAEGDT